MALERPKLTSFLRVNQNIPHSPSAPAVELFDVDAEREARKKYLQANEAKRRSKLDIRSGPDEQKLSWNFFATAVKGIFLAQTVREKGK